MTLDHNFKGIVSGSTDYLNSITHYYHRQGLTSLKLMEEKTGTLPMSFYLPRGHFLIDAYNDVIRRLRDAGITEYWENYYLRRNEKIEDLGPQVLTLEQLAVCFYVSMFPLTFAFVAFFFEFYSKGIKLVSHKAIKRLKIIVERNSKLFECRKFKCFKLYRKYTKMFFKSHKTITNIFKRIYWLVYKILRVQWRRTAKRNIRSS